MRQVIQVVVTVYPAEKSSLDGVKFGNGVAEEFADQATAEAYAKRALEAALKTLEPSAFER